MQRLKDLGVALSLANLCWFGVWAELLPGSPAHYFHKAPPPAVAFAAVAVNVTVLAAVLWVGAQTVRWSKSARLHALARAAFLATVAVAVNGIRLNVPRLGLTGLAAWCGHTGVVAIAVGSAAGAVFVLWRWQVRVAQAVATVVLVCAPFILVTFGRAAWALVDTRGTLASFREQPLVAAVADRGPRPPRVLWMIFDELDQRLAFSERPPGAVLPELDRFRAEALFATQAYPPAGQTLVSLPALVTGKLIATAWPAGTSELFMALDGRARPDRWSTESTVFAEARKSGWSSAVVGWYHPYCRVIGGLARCSWEEWKDPWATTFRESVARQIARVAEALPAAQPLGLRRAIARLEAALGAARHRQFAVEHYRHTLAAAQDALADPSTDLIFVHWPIPHPPAIYDRVTGQLTGARPRGDHPRRRATYLDNLVLADRAFGEVRRTLERAGEWEHTTIIVSADHGYRTSLWAPKLRTTDEERTVVAGHVDYRVPFLLKVAGDNRALIYDAEFNTLITHDLVLALLAEQVHNTQDAARWLDAHRSLGKSPFMKEWG